MAVDVGLPGALQFRVLGALEVGRGNELVDVGSSNERKILAALLVHANAVVSTSRLIETLWGEDPPASDRNALQTYVARLRRRLRTPDTLAPIVTRPPGYAIELGPDQLDSLRFRRLVEEARTALVADPTRSLDLLDESLGLWRGPAFAEFADHDVARAEAFALEELRQSAMESRVEALLALGRITDAICELERLVVAHPLSERPHALLMRALAVGGRQVEALRLYQRFRGRLTDELGLEPSASLRELETQILRQTPQVAPSATLPPVGNLAPPITAFVGREHDLDALKALLTTARVVTLVGVGGVGKSRLAVRVAEAVAPTFADGAWIVELARLNAPEGVPHAVATALGVTLPTGTEVSDALVEALRSRRMLVVIDNCEHVLSEAARVVELLSRRCRGLVVVATSRERLGVGGENLWPVQPLPVPEPAASAEAIAASPAVTLFVDRARAARADFSLGEANLAAVADICRGLDGLPLALEIAAARLGVINPHDLAKRLRDRFALLTAGPRDEGERHRTLRALVDWSYGLLDTDERALFDRLSVFAGGWTLEAALGVCADISRSESDIAALVASLADKSMIVPPPPSGPARYGMLETLRLYGAERLHARGETDQVLLAHARYFTIFAEQAEAELRGPDEGEWVRSLRLELDNLRAAHAWSRNAGDTDLAFRLSVALHRFATWQANDEILSWGEAALQMPGVDGHPLLPLVTASVSVRRMHRGEMQVATEYAERALAMCGDPDDTRRALAVESLAGVCLLSGRLEQSLEHSVEFARLWRLAGYDQGEVWGLCNRGVATAKLGDLAKAFSLIQEAKLIAERTGNPTMMALTSYAEGEALLDVEPVPALEPLGEALAFARAGENVFMSGNALLSNTSLQGRLGDPMLALGLFEDVIEYWRRSGGWTQLLLTLRNLVELVTRLGAHEDAAVLYGACTSSPTAQPSYGAEAERLEAVVATLRSSLGDQGFADAAGRGAALNDEESVAYASSVIGRLLKEVSP